MTDTQHKAIERLAEHLRSQGHVVKLDFSGKGPVIATKDPCHRVTIGDKVVLIHSHPPNEPCR